MNIASDYAAVFVGYLKDGSEAWGPIGIEQAESERGRLFHCGHCSLPDHRVYHNILGNHRHITEVELLERIANAPQQ